MGNGQFEPTEWDQNTVMNVAMLGARQLVGLLHPKKILRKRSIQEAPETVPVDDQQYITAPHDLV